MQSSVAAIRRGRLQARFVTTVGHHRVRRYGLTAPSRGRLVPAMRPIGGPARVRSASAPMAWSYAVRPLAEAGASA
jgi:hypothetical protein